MRILGFGSTGEGKGEVMEAFTADPFTSLLSTIYQLSAKDRVDIAFHINRDLELKGDYVAKIAGIVDDTSFSEFVASLPTMDSFTELVKQEIREEYARVEESIATHEQRREAALESPPVDFSRLGRDLTKELSDRLRIVLRGVRKIDDQKGFDDYKVGLENEIGKIVRDKIENTTLPGFHEGDFFEVTAMEGFDFEGDVFYHGGDDEDVALGSQGELLRIVSDEQVTLKLSDGRTWEFHPDELSSTGRNSYREILREADEDLDVATRILVDREVTKILPGHLEEARVNVRRLFDAELGAITQRIVQKYDLSDEQMAALKKGEDFDYRIKSMKNPTEVAIPFDKIAALALRSMEFRLGKKIEYGNGEIRTEEQMKSFIRGAAEAAIGKGDEGKLANLIRRTANELSPLLVKQHDLKERELRVREELPDILNNVANYLMTNDVWFRRLLLYNDRTLFRAGDPFAPPSQEWPRVIKLETGDGCDYGECTFCLEYAGAKFFIRKTDDFKKHAEAVREKLGDDAAYIERIFLAGGNLFVLPTKKLLSYVGTAKKLFDGQKKKDPRMGRRYGNRTYVRRVEAFSRTEGILRKSVKDLNKLQEAGLNLLYWGCETGSQGVLDYVKKGITREQMDEAADKLAQTNIWLSLMIMPGLGGMRFYEDHVRQTVDLINKIKPRFTTFHTITPKPGTEYVDIMAAEVAAGTNRPLTDEEVVEQMHDIVSGLQGGYTSLVATYYPPSAKIAINPVSFRGYLQLGEKAGILRTLQGYFADGKDPSLAIPDTDFNKGSRLRIRARQQK